MSYARYKWVDAAVGQGNMMPVDNVDSSCTLSPAIEKDRREHGHSNDRAANYPAHNSPNVRGLLTIELGRAFQSQHDQLVVSDEVRTLDTHDEGAAKLKAAFKTSRAAIFPPRAPPVNCLRRICSINTVFHLTWISPTKGVVQSMLLSRRCRSVPLLGRHR